MSSVELEGYASKLPTWQTGSSEGKEDQFRLRYFVITSDGLVSYYKSRNFYQASRAARGQFNVKDCILRRESKLEFSITTTDWSRRLYIRAMSEPLLLTYMTAISKAGGVATE
jgi:hypothetical protein